MELDFALRRVWVLASNIVWHRAEGKEPDAYACIVPQGRKDTAVLRIKALLENLRSLLLLVAFELTGPKLFVEMSMLPQPDLEKFSA